MGLLGIFWYLVLADWNDYAVITRRCGLRFKPGFRKGCKLSQMCRASGVQRDASTHHNNTIHRAPRTHELIHTPRHTPEPNLIM